MKTLFHRHLGGQDPKPLVFLHGLLGSSRNWQTTGAAFAEDFNVLAVDLRNHGRSFHDPVMTYESMVDDMVKALGRLVHAPVTLVGHSMGGKVAMALAARHPELVARLVVVDIAPKNYHSNAHRLEFAAMNELDLRTLTSRGEAELKFEGRVSDWAMRKFLTTNLEKDEHTGVWRWLVNLPVLTGALEHLEQTSLTEDDVYEGPTLFLSGGKSRYVSEEDKTAIYSHFPASERQVIAEAGHNPHMETRQEFVEALDGFFART